MTENNTNETTLNPDDYFTLVKNAIEELDDEKLLNIKTELYRLLEKSKRAGQLVQAQNLLASINNLKIVSQLVELGFNKIVPTAMLHDYMDNVADKAVIITDVELYPRELPDEAIELIEQTKGFFDKFFIMFTDYSQGERKKISKSKRKKDPILFGAFTNKIGNTTRVSEELYYLCDWVDEHCDLTLNKLVREMAQKKRPNTIRELVLPKNPDDFLKDMLIENPKLDGSVLGRLQKIPVIEKKTLFQKIRSILKK